MTRSPANSPHPHPVSRGKPLGFDQIVPLARRVTESTRCPVVGGVAVMLHGRGSNTRDIDIYSDDFWRTHERLEAAGFLWNAATREHVIDGVAVHMVGDESLGGPPRRAGTLHGVKVIGLADLIRAKLTVGLVEVRRSTDIAHVLDPIERVPLTKAFAAKLPARLRAPFNRLVTEVRGPRRAPVPPTVFRDRYARSLRAGAAGRSTKS